MWGSFLPLVCFQTSTFSYGREKKDVLGHCQTAPTSEENRREHPVFSWSQFIVLVTTGVNILSDLIMAQSTPRHVPTSPKLPHLFPLSPTKFQWAKKLFRSKFSYSWAKKTWANPKDIYRPNQLPSTKHLSWRSYVNITWVISNDYSGLGIEMFSEKAFSNQQLNSGVLTAFGVFYTSSAH